MKLIRINFEDIRQYLVEHMKDTKQYTRGKAERLVKYYDRIQKIEVILSADGNEKMCEIIVDVAHSHNLVAEATGRDLHAAIDNRSKHATLLTYPLYVVSV